MLCVAPSLVLATAAAAATPTLTSQVSQPSGDPRGPMIDTATLSGGTNPQGSMVFTVFGPSDPTCSGAPYATTTTLAVFGNGTFTSDPVQPFASGIYRWIATYSGDANNPAVATACGDPAETVVVPQVVPALSTHASSSVGVGNPITDAASLSGFGNLGGTITFSLFGPDDPTCAAPPVFVAPPVAVNGSATYSSAPFTPTAVGTYRWVAVYSGDTENSPAASPCDDPAEAVVITVPQPVTIATFASQPGFNNGMFDSATLSGGVTPTGDVRFDLYRPDDALCAGPPVFTSTGPPISSAPPLYASNFFFAATPGTYRWVATYLGDANNAEATGVCGDPAETVVVFPPPNTTLTTEASGTVAVGDKVGDVAHLSSANNPTGTITFGLFGPDNVDCSGPPIYAPLPVVVNGSGRYVVEPFTVTVPGTYRWVAFYSGDAHNDPVATTCGDPAETVVVKPPKLGSLTICVAKTNGAGPSTFTVEGQSVIVEPGQCSPTIRVLAGTVTVTEAPTPGFRLARCTTMPTGRILACRRHAGEAVVRVAAGGIAKQTTLIITNRRVR